MDGTLLDDEKHIPEDFYELMDKFEDKDVVFGIGSGRQYETLRREFPGHADKMLFISDNGSIVHFRGECLWVEEISEDVIRRTVELCRSNGRYAVLCGEKSAYVEDVKEDFLEGARLYYKNLRIVDDLYESMEEDRICKISVYDSVDSEKYTYPILKELSDSLQVSVSGLNWIDMMRIGVNKGMAVSRLKEKYGIDEKDCIAFGDYMNDYEMMQECYYSYAMENATPELKKVCRFRAPSNNDRGVVKVLSEIL
jgi:Cof subfamily protein (haloacid dehalogenase superfamily)